MATKRPGLKAQAACKCGNGSHVFSREEMLARVQKYLDSVSDPQNPKCCPRCFAVLAHAIFECPLVVDALKVHAHPFWESCLSLRIIYREGDIPRLRQLLRENQVACPERAALHRGPIHRNLPDPFDMLILTLENCIIVAAEKGKMPVKKPGPGGSTKNFDRRLRHWPTSQEQLFPLGVERGVDSLIDWCCTPLSFGAFKVLCVFLTVARAPAMPFILASPRRERLAWALLQALTTGPVPWEGPPPFISPPGLAVSANARVNAPNMLEVAIVLLTMLHDHSCVSAPDEGVRFFAGYESLFISTFEGILNGPAGANMQSFVRMSLIGSLDFLRQIQGLPQLPDDDRTPNRLHSFFHNALMHAAYSRTCGNPACRAPETSGASAPKFQVCAQCKFIRYCSRECQRKDWKDGVPHKSVCSTLSRVVAACTPVADYDLFMRAYPACNLEPEEEARLSQWAMASDPDPLWAWGYTNQGVSQ